MSIFLYIVLFILSLSTVRIYSQITQSDKSAIVSFISSKKDEKSGLFFLEDEKNLKAIEILTILKENFDRKRICRELDYSVDEPNLYKIIMNNKLSCKTQFNFSKLELTLNENSSIKDIHIIILYSREINIELDYNNLYNYLISYKTKNNLFSNTKNSDLVSLKNTFLALRILNHLQNLDDSVEFSSKDNINAVISSILNEIESKFQRLSDNIGVFFDKSNAKDIFELNYEAIVGLNECIQKKPNEKISKILSSIRNYVLEFKYSFNDLNNIFYILKSLEILNSLPILSIEKNFIYKEDDDKFELKLINNFEELIENYEVTILYKEVDDDKKSQKKDKKEKPKKNLSDDLDDLSDDDVNQIKKDDDALINGKLIFSEGRFQFRLDFPSHGVYNFKFEVTLIEKSTKEQILISEKVTLKMLQKIKVNYIEYKLEGSASDDNDDKKEVKLEYPKRSFKSLNANQHSILKIKVKLSTEGSTRPEQFFLKLKHNELDKTAVGLATKFIEKGGVHLITFDFSDHNQIEAYDGVYDMTLILSDENLENPIIWSFGKVEIKFSKPLDPLNVIQTYKNAQKPKIEIPPKSKDQNKSSIVSKNQYKLKYI